MRFPDELWWEQISRPQQLKEKVVDVLLRGKSVWISGHLPWKDTFQDQIKTRLSEMDSRLRLLFYNVEDLAEESPADLIFRIMPGAKTRYMPGRSLSDYIVSNKILETTIIWISGLDETRNGAWFEFSSGLAKAGSGLRVVCHGNCGKKRYQNVITLYTEEYMSQFERILFAMLLSGTENGSTDLQMYFSYLSAELAGESVENIPLLLSDTQKLALNPWAFLEEKELTAAGDIKRIVHDVQMKVLQPKLEDRREKLVDALTDKLEALLPFKDDYGNDCTELYDIELRHMIFYQGHLQLTPQQKKELDQLYNIRNMAAHRKIISGKDIMVLLCDRMPN